MTSPHRPRTTPLYVLTATVAVLLLNVQNAAACGVVGQVFCDSCGDGSFTSGKDNHLAGLTVKADCTVTKSGLIPTTTVFAAVGVTGSDGKFNAPFVSSSALGILPDIAFMALVSLSNINLGKGLDGLTISCKISITGAPEGCNKLSINNGVCTGDGSGNGLFTNAALDLKASVLNALQADIYLGVNAKVVDTLCLIPSVKPASCTPGSTGDPHYTGADGSRFDFSGEPNAHFCLLSDAHIHVNAFYGGWYGQYESNPHKALTWIRQLGIMWGHHTITLAAREGANWQYDNGYMARMEVDGEEAKLSQAGDSVSFANGAIELKWLAAKMQSADDLVDVYQVKIKGVLSLRLTLRPEVAALRTEEDGIVHFDFELPQADISDSAHGVLGQTFRADRRHKLGEQTLVYSSLLHTNVVPGDNGEGFLDGSIADYRASGLLATDCPVTRFARASSRDLETAQALELASGAVVSTVGLNRKMLKSAVAAS